MSAPRLAVGLLAALAVLGPQLEAQKKSSPPPRITKSKSAPVAAIDSIRFEDVTRKAGLDFHLTCGTPQKLYIMDAMCGGVAVFDYDRDGWMDIFFIAGATAEQLKTGTAPLSRLYHNNHDGTFTDVTEKMGLTHRGWGMGVAVGDFDNDGFDDLYITYLDHAVLYRNVEGKRFEDVTAKAGVGNVGRWGTSAAFADYDRDGHLDLYIANYVDVDLDHLPAFGGGPNCQYRGIKVSCGPRGLKGSRDRLYHNRGDGTFEDVSEKLDIDPGAFYGLGVVWLDFNGDGCPDVYVANDSSPSLLYQGDCHGGFHEVGVTAGVAYSADGQEQAGMGVDSADYDGDGRPDLAKINFSDDTNNLFHNDGNGEFTDMGGPSGFGPISTPFLGFGVKFLDADNDGWPDVAVADGHVNPQVDGHRFGVTYAERNLFFHNLGNGRFEEMGLRAGPAWKVPRVGRGLATADFDNDGRVDMLFTNLDGSPLLLRNVTPPAGRHWIAFRLRGKTSNRDALGARVEVLVGGRRQVAEVRANSSYLSASDPRPHFGLGRSATVEKVVIFWPSGAKSEFADLAADRYYDLTEAEQLKVLETKR